MKDLTFLPAIPMNLEFAKYFNNNSEKLLIEGEVFRTGLGKPMFHTILAALSEVNAPYELRPTILKLELADKKRVDFRKMLSVIPPEFFALLGILALVMNGFLTLAPQIFEQKLAVAAVFVGFFLLLLSLIFYWYRRIESNRKHSILTQDHKP